MMTHEQDKIRQLRRDYWYDYRDGLHKRVQCEELTDEQVIGCWRRTTGQSATLHSQNAVLEMRRQVLAGRAAQP